ncbi:uncharacterized protein [Onthophagus taurus]|uniref:uncharacterized protein isoform X2 n=1 Tax=Onthophagus taurus TaxID=166361 RepID=UPI0039BDA909
MQNCKIVFCLILLWINFFRSFSVVVVGEPQNLISINETANMEVKKKLENVNMKALHQTRNLKSKCLQIDLNKEVPKCDLQQNDTKLLINLKRIQTGNCEFYYHLVINGSNEGCAHAVHITHIVKTVNDKNFMNDVSIWCGLSNYTVDLGISWNKDIIVQHKNICAITAGPIAPRPIREIKVYEETNTSVSIRWPEPYPKNGILELTTIEYKKRDKYWDFGNIASVEWIERNITKPKACEIWERNFCIKAKNKDVEEFSKAGTAVFAITTEKPPASPIKIATIWDDFLNLTINCSYPLNAKGPIRKLNISINNTEMIFDIPNNTRNYSFNIDASNYSSTRQEIMVLFSNFAGKSKSIKEIVIIPPRTPILRDGLIKETDENVFVDLSLIENVHNKSKIYVYYINKKSNTALNKNCNDFDILENKSTKKITIYPNNNKTTTLTKNKETSQCIIVIFVKNSFEKYSRCSTYRVEPIFSKKDTPNTPNIPSAQSDNLIIIIIVLILLLIILGVTIYMYKIKRITCKSSINKFCHAVEIENFINYVDNAIRDGKLLQQFNMVEKLDTKLELDSDTMRKHNISYDGTGTRLVNHLDSTAKDYINPNYINGFNEDQLFIAAQSPIKSSIRNFWKMIWDENVECIVALTNLNESEKEKYAKYWPELKKSLEYSGITIACINSNTTSDIIIRTFEISSNSSNRKLVQIHYSGKFRQDELTIETVINILHLMKNHGNRNPTLVHCSDGIGRTGIIILSNIAATMAEKAKTIDMFSIFYYLRQQRPKMVQTYAQYVLAHQVLATLSDPIYTFPVTV